MRNLGSVWNTLFASDTATMETVAVINNIEYSAITSPVVHQNLLSSDTLTVGNCISASLTFTVKTTNPIPKSASVVIKCRLKDGSASTSWYEFGTFWVAKREVDDDLVTLECYDAMLKGNQAYGGSNDAMNWPKPMQTVVNTIASRMGVSLDSRNSIRSDSSVYKCEYPGDLTLLEVLGYIGACQGGNWIITPENKLRLVPLTGGSSTVNVPVVLSQITEAKSYTVSGVTMVVDEDHVYSAGNNSGYVLTINPNPYASQTITNNLLTALNGLTYQPFAISGAIYNPAAELGDAVTVGSISSMLIAETRTYDIIFRADAEAPGKDELEDEYPYPSEILRLQQSTVELKRNDEVLSSRIDQTQESILATVSETYVDDDTYQAYVSATNLTLTQHGAKITSIEQNYTQKSEIRSQFALDPSNITLSAGVDEHGNPTGRITFNAGTLVVNSTNFSVDADGILRCNGAEVNGKMTTQITDNNNTYKTINEAGEINFYKNNTLYGNISIKNKYDSSGTLNYMYSISSGQNQSLCLCSSGNADIIMKNNTIDIDGATLRLYVDNIQIGQTPLFSGMASIQNESAITYIYVDNGLITDIITEY